MDEVSFFRQGHKLRTTEAVNPNRATGENHNNQVNSLRKVLISMNRGTSKPINTYLMTLYRYIFHRFGPNVENNSNL